jgi:hypothetical protein
VTVRKFVIQYEIRDERDKLLFRSVAKVHQSVVVSVIESVEFENNRDRIRGIINQVTK